MPSISILKRRSLAAARGAPALAVLFAGARCPLGASSGSPRDPESRLAVGTPVAGESVPPRYGRDIRPILSERCFRCHGADANTREAGLRLDVAESALAARDGATPIVPGDLEASELWRRITSDDPAVRMPPPASLKPPLSQAERAEIARWIESGAVYEPHWSFTPPVRPPLPAVSDAAWSENPIDRFVLARLEGEGIAPSPEAEPETAIRRLFLDLTGLPPTPEEQDRFLADARPDAWERWVDLLLEAEPYKTRGAEHRARAWLDAARYADTCGIHTDAGRSIWPWRDWVLSALRDDQPFDRFVVEQLAGDLLPGATLEQKVASGFHRNHVTTDEGGAIAEEYLVEYAVDRTATTGSVLLGLTVGCARCHDHKFDPISQREFYSLYAFFNSVDEPGLYSQLPDPKRAHEPFLQVPSEEQARRREALRAELAAAEAERDAPVADEDQERDRFVREMQAEAGVRWQRPEVLSATSRGGATMSVEPDRSVLVSGTNPERDEHVLVLETREVGLRMILLESLADPRLPEGRPGRAPNGNAVLTGFELDAVSLAEPARRERVRFSWAWADHEQASEEGGDFSVLHTLDAADARGWAIDAHKRPGGRRALYVAEAEFGFAGGTRLEARLVYGSKYAQHAFGRVRIGVSPCSAAALARLPVAATSWYLAGPFAAEDRAKAFEADHGPERDPLDLARVFGAGATERRWKHSPLFTDGPTHELARGAGLGTTYLGRRLHAPSARKLDVSLGSDDGARLFLGGREVFSRKVDRSLAADQDRTSLELPDGPSTLVFAVVNTSGETGFQYRPLAREGELGGDLVASLFPEDALDTELAERVRHAWRLAFSPTYRALAARVEHVAKEVQALEAAIPKTMVMKELGVPRETFVLERGAYDKPDKSRPVERDVPAALGRFPAEAPRDRLGLAQWLVAPENPLVARVAVNRAWEQVFGTGIVATTEDFGLQGEWPSHPELLDWLAVEFREQGWSQRALLRRIVGSRTYRQSSRVRTELLERDPENRLLAYFPRRRLAAEAIRDQALYVSGLLVERLGGPSVKPYQPPGLWQEVAMPASNTRVYEQGRGEDLWRRSLYTYWKRALPPPSMLTLDAPTREYCTIRRATTNTPLQVLVLWNDPQFVEAASALAQRTLGEAGGDEPRLARMFRRCTGRSPDPEEARALGSALERFRARYAGDPAAALELVSLGESCLPPELDVAELAAWTMVASAHFSLDGSLNRN